MFYFVLFLFLIIISGPCSRYPCDPSCDMKIPPCNGLIFEDEFDSFDLDTWEHELTAGGGGVGKPNH